MNRFQRQLEIAMQAINEMQDEHRILTHAYRDAVAENRRLRFQTYGRQPRSFEEALVAGQEAIDRRKLRTKINNYFDVTKWLWVAEAVIPYSVPHE